MKRRDLLTAGLAGAGAQLLAGCQPTPLPVHAAPPRMAVTVYVIAEGWHTDIALPARAMTDRVPNLTRDFPNAGYLRFGWGQRQYYMASEPTTLDGFRALFPGLAVLLVTPLERTPDGEHVLAIGLTSAGLSRLADYVSAAFARTVDDAPVRLAFGPNLGSAFYAATGTYSVAFTCNTWTAEALHVGGLPVSSADVVFASQVMDQVRPLSGAHH